MGAGGVSRNISWLGGVAAGGGGSSMGPPTTSSVHLNSVELRHFKDRREHCGAQG